MTLEKQRESNKPPIVDPREFLSRPFERLEIGELVQPPDIALLKWLTTLPDETGLVYQEPRWFIIKANSIGVPAWIVPEKSDILIHSHPMLEAQWVQDRRSEYLDRLVIECLGEFDSSLPSRWDFGNCSPVGKNFIVSQKGLTQYWPILARDESHFLSIDEIEVMGKRFGNILELKVYLQFLKEVGARFNLYPWEQLDQEKLNSLFYQQL